MKQKDILTLPDGKHDAGDGLRLVVRGASRLWVVRVQINGRRIERSLGNARAVSLTQARTLADKTIRLLRSGELITRKKAEPPESRTFRDVAHEAIKLKASVVVYKSDKSESRMHFLIDTYAKNLLNRPVEEIIRDDVIKTLNAVWLTRPETGKRLRLVIELALAYAVSIGLRQDNPAVWRNNLSLFLPSTSRISITKNHEAPTLEELRTATKHFMDQRTVGSLAIVFGALTATRAHEFIEAQWNEFDLQKAVWSIPPERRKDGKPYPHRIPLSTQAVRILDLLPRKSEFLFPGQRSKTLNRESPRIMLSRAVGRPVTMHGCRSTFRDWCAENGKSRDLAEKSLMHSTGSEVEKAYQRSDLLEQRRPLMQEWSDELFKETWK